MSVDEMLELRRMADKAPIDAVCLAFEYGQAKGARAASFHNIYILKKEEQA